MEQEDREGLNLSDLEILSRLSQREREILRLIFSGKCSSEVATIMCVSKRTVDFHLARAYAKLGATSRYQAFRKALDLGLVESEP
jgi:DNA-binding CsgD family transcriptional regulator